MMYAPASSPVITMMPDLSVVYLPIIVPELPEMSSLTFRTSNAAPASSSDVFASVFLITMLFSG